MAHGGGGLGNSTNHARMRSCSAVLPVDPATQGHSPDREAYQTDVEGALQLVDAVSSRDSNRAPSIHTASGIDHQAAWMPAAAEVREPLARQTTRCGEEPGDLQHSCWLPPWAEASSTTARHLLKPLGARPRSSSAQTAIGETQKKKSACRCQEDLRSCTDFRSAAHLTSGEVGGSKKAISAIALRSQFLKSAITSARQLTHHECTDTTPDRTG